MERMSVRDAIIMDNIYEYLSSEDINKLSGVNFYLITRDNYDDMYKDFQNSTNNKIFYLIHYETNTLPSGVKNGHWCSMFINKSIKRVYFFDSYGYVMDLSRKYIKNSYLVATGQNHKVITEFVNYLQDLGYKAYYNEYDFQKMEDGIATCGRYATLFFKYFNAYPSSTLESFQKLIMDLPTKMGINKSDKIKYDKAITLATI